MRRRSAGNRIQSFVVDAVSITVVNRLVNVLNWTGNPPSVIVLDLTRLETLEPNSAAGFGRVAQQAREVGILVVLAGVNPSVRRALGASGALDEIDPGRVFDDVDGGFAYARRVTGAS